MKTVLLFYLTIVSLFVLKTALGGFQGVRFGSHGWNLSHSEASENASRNQLLKVLSDEKETRE